MISCITSVMDRTEHLEQMLPSWTRIEKIDDFVIVDWSSTIPIIENKVVLDQINKYKNIKIIRVENQKYFYRCKAWNLAFKYTNPKNKILLKLDADSISLDPSWIDYLSFDESLVKLKRHFITGCNDFYLDSSGFLLVNKEDFENVNGYNENLLSLYGYDDIDLNLRLDNYLVNKYSIKLPQITEWTNSRKVFFFNINQFVFNLKNSYKEKIHRLKGKYPTEENKIKPKIDDYARVNEEIAITQKEWNHQNYETIFESENYLRLSISI